MDDELKAQVRDLIDRDRIWQIMLRYCRGIDRFDRALVRSCYWDDAIDDHHVFGGTPDQFLDHALGWHGSAQTLHHHGVTNHSVELDGNDAHGETYYSFIGVHPDGEGPHMFGIGRYIDHYQRRGGEWRIAARVCVIERTFQLHDDLRVPIPTDHPVLGPPSASTRDRSDVSYQRPVRPRPYPVDGVDWNG